MEDDTGGTGGSIGGLGYWKQNLYLLQERAPKPLAVTCNRVIENRPPQYGNEFHGLIDRVEGCLKADRMLMEAGEGAFLVRESKRSQDAFTLCMLFDGRVLNYKLYYDGTHYVGEKRFETMELLVADGLISMFMDKHASDYIKRMADEAIYEHSPYMQYTKSSERKPVARSHSFTQYTFKMPHYCDYCRNFMWGLVQQGVRCETVFRAPHKAVALSTLCPGTAAYSSLT
ncbi:SH2 domain protein [Ostertagia ostertagi]